MTWSEVLEEQLLLFLVHVEAQVADIFSASMVASVSMARPGC